MLIFSIQIEKWLNISHKTTIMETATKYPTPKEFYTEEEYFLLEEQASYRSEYVGGKIIAIAGGTAAHNAICVNVYGEFYSALKGSKCRLYSSNMKLAIPGQGKYYYPDAMVLCGEERLQPGKKDILQNPNLIIEVLSQSTESVDRGKKFQDYFSLPSVKEYMIIDQYQIRVELFQKLTDREWKYYIYSKKEEEITCSSIPIKITVDSLYTHVSFEESQTP